MQHIYGQSQEKKVTGVVPKGYKAQWGTFRNRRLKSSHYTILFLFAWQATVLLRRIWLIIINKIQVCRNVSSPLQVISPFALREGRSSHLSITAGTFDSTIFLSYSILIICTASRMQLLPSRIHNSKCFSYEQFIKIIQKKVYFRNYYWSWM
jgi:hypothetical protein